MHFKFIDPLSPEYEKERMLRWEVLRKPLGLPPGSEMIPQDAKSLHLIAIEKKQIIGCVCYLAETTAGGEIFQMAVSEEYQGQGFGRKLLHAMEHALFEKGVEHLHVFAWHDVEGFYAKMGYRAEGEYVNKNGIECRLMQKELVHNEK